MYVVWIEKTIVKFYVFLSEQDFHMAKDELSLEEETYFAKEVDPYYFTKLHNCLILGVDSTTTPQFIVGLKSIGFLAKKKNTITWFLERKVSKETRTIYYTNPCE